MSQTLEPAVEAAHRCVTVKVNTKAVELRKHRVTGVEIKEAAIAQGVRIELDFQLTLEARHGHPAEVIGDHKTIDVTEHSHFTANDVDDDS